MLGTILLTVVYKKIKFAVAFGSLRCCKANCSPVVLVNPGHNAGMPCLHVAFSNFSEEIGL
jgi:hypothetical protein